MRQQILHTPEGVRDIYGIECRRKLMLEENYKKSCTYTDIKIYRHRCSSFLMFSEKRLVHHLQRNFINFFDRDGEYTCVETGYYAVNRKSCSHIFGFKRTSGPSML